MGKNTLHMHKREYDYLIALDSFKGSMTSYEAGLAVKKGLESVDPDANISLWE